MTNTLPKIKGILVESTYIILNSAEQFSVGNKGVGIHFANNNHPIYIWPTDEPRKPYVDVSGSLIVETSASPMTLIKKLNK